MPTIAVNEEHEVTSMDRHDRAVAEFHRAGDTVIKLIEACLIDGHVVGGTHVQKYHLEWYSSSVRPT